MAGKGAYVSRGLPLQGEPWLVEAAQVAWRAASYPFRLQAGTLLLSFGEGVLLRTVVPHAAAHAAIYPPRRPRPHLLSLRAQAPPLVGVAGQFATAAGWPAAVRLTPFWAYAPGASHSPVVAGAQLALAPYRGVELGLLALHGGQVAASGRFDASGATVRMELARLPQGQLLWRGRAAALGMGPLGLALSASSLDAALVPYTRRAPAGKRVGLLVSWQASRAATAWQVTWHRPRRPRSIPGHLTLQSSWRQALRRGVVLQTHVGARRAWKHLTPERVSAGAGVRAQLPTVLSTSLVGRTHYQMRHQAWGTVLQVQGRAHWRRLLALRLRAAHRFGGAKPSTWRLGLAAEAPLGALGLAVGAGWQWEAQGRHRGATRLQAYVHATL